MSRTRTLLSATANGDSEARSAPASLPNTPASGNRDCRLGAHFAMEPEWDVNRRARTSSPLIDASGALQVGQVEDNIGQKLPSSFQDNTSPHKAGQATLPLLGPNGPAAATHASRAEVAAAHLASPVHPEVVPLFTPVGALGAHGTPHSHLGRLPDGRLVQLYPPVERASQACELCRRVSRADEDCDWDMQH